MSVALRRSIIAVAVLAAGAGLWWVYDNAVVGSDATSDNRPDAVERLIPEPGSEVLTQAVVGIDVAVGYDADLEINGTRITELAATPEDDGLRKNLEIGLVEYLPGPGKQIERLEPTRNCVVARVWSRQEGPERAEPISWCFDAT